MGSTTSIQSIGERVTLAFIFVMLIVHYIIMKQTLDESIKELERLLEIQCDDGNWNHSPYMHGMANGMIFALSVMTGKDPEYLDPPDIFLNDLTQLDKFNKSSIIVNNEAD